MYIYVYKCIGVHRYMPHSHLSVYIYTYMLYIIHMYIHRNASYIRHTYVHILAFFRGHVYMYVYILYVCICMIHTYICMHIHTYIYHCLGFVKKGWAYKCYMAHTELRIFPRACIYVCIYTICMYMYDTYIHMYAFVCSAFWRLLEFFPKIK